METKTKTCPTLSLKFEPHPRVSSGLFSSFFWLYPCGRAAGNSASSRISSLWEPVYPSWYRLRAKKSQGCREFCQRFACCVVGFPSKLTLRKTTSPELAPLLFFFLAFLGSLCFSLTGQKENIFLLGSDFSSLEKRCPLSSFLAGPLTRPDPHPPLRWLIGVGGISTPGDLNLGQPIFNLLWGRLNKWNCGTPTPLPLKIAVLSGKLNGCGAARLRSGSPIPSHKIIRKGCESSENITTRKRPGVPGASG